MNTWITSDLHFFHKNIIQYCGRPFTDEYHMNDMITKVWNDTVSAGDRVILVGDMTAGLFDRKEELRMLITQLKGQKTLVVGNHDHLSKKWYLEAGFSCVVKSMFENNILFVHKPATDLNLREVKLKAQLKPEIIVHGHIHAPGENIAGHYNVAWDRHQRLINLDEIINMSAS